MYVVFIILCVFNFYGCSSIDIDAFNKDINENDLKLEYTVYPSFISVKLTALVDIENLNVQVVYYQDGSLNQDMNLLELEFLKKDSVHFMPNYDLTDCEFDRVALKTVSGKKRISSESFDKCIRIGTIRFPTEKLDTDLFGLRVDETQRHSTSFGVLYITSPIDLWHIDLEICEGSKTYIVQNIDEILAYQEYPIELKKSLGDESPLPAIQLKSIKASKTKDLIVS